MTVGYLGIDVGLSGARAAVISSDGRVLVKARIEQNTNRLSPSQLSSLVDRTVRLALDKRHGLGVAGIAVCAFGPSPIFLNGNGQLLKRLPLFDQRKLRPKKPQQSGDDLASRIKDFRRSESGMFSKARFVCDVTSFLVSRLTGRMVMDHITAEDYKRGALFKNLKYPEISRPDSLAGTLTPQSAKRLGLPPGIPVAVGSYDSSADIDATGFGQSGTAAIIFGSTLVLGTLTEKPLRDKMLRSIPHVGQGWFSGGWTNMAGSSLSLAERLLAPGAETTSGATPMVLPYFAGERSPIWAENSTGVIAGIKAETTADDLRQAFMEGVVLSAADIAERLEEECGAIRRWTVVGGATRNSTLMQALSDALGSRLDVLKHAGESLGPALLAAKSCGVQVRLPIEIKYYSRKTHHRRFTSNLRLYRKVYEALAPLMDDISRNTGFSQATS